MENYPICETIEEYEPQLDDINNCYRDMNNSEIKIKYGIKPFRCCGIEYTKGKRSQSPADLAGCASLRFAKPARPLNI